MTTNKIWTYALHTTWIPVSCYLLTNHAFKVSCYLILISCDALPDWAIVVYMVGEVRLELTRPDGQWILSPLWLPIPSLPHEQSLVLFVSPRAVNQTGNLGFSISPELNTVYEKWNLFFISKIIIIYLRT